MLVIGLTGPTGAGKGTVASVFERYGIPVINADRVYHELITPPSSCLQELADAFGKDIILSNGTLDRRTLSSIVFNDPSARERLNTITHRYVMEEVQTRMERFRREGVPVAMRRILAQKSDDFFKTHSDYIIENNGAAELLAPEVHRILQKLGVIPK